MKYWFRPKRFWKWFAAYYPSSIEGWAVTLVLVVFAVVIFIDIDRKTHLVSDALVSFIPWMVAIFAIFDVFCFRKGEYPSWWRKKGE